MTSRDDRILMIAAAKLRSEGWQQVSIAEYLDSNQARISRMLKKAIEEGILIPWPSLVEVNIKSDEWEEVERSFFVDKKLIEQIGLWLPEKLHLDVRVLPQAGDEFCSAAADRVLGLLKRSRRLGVMWGRTIREVINGIEKRHTDFQSVQSRSFECIPLCGDPVQLMNQGIQEYSASRLAGRLEQILVGSEHPQGSDHPQLPSLTGVPAYIPQRYLAKNGTNTTLQSFIQSIPGYRKIFGAGKRNVGKPLVDSVDTILTGVGIIVFDQDSREYETAAFLRERIAQEDISKEELSKLVYGDIGGLLIERRDLTEDKMERVKGLNAGWTGIKSTHLQRIARQAASNGPAGVIVVASGAAKAPMIKEIITRGYVNELIIDQSLCDELRQLS
jgi:DNA-binding transcriptional regulator LsrR (DeoR family)